MIEALRIKNESIKDLKKKLKQAPARQSILEVDDLLINVADRRAFILLLDMYETEKEITRELLENLIDHSFELNNGILLHIENNVGLHKQLKEFFDVSNIKSILLLALALGIALSIAFHGEVAPEILNVITKSKTEDKR